MSREIELLTEIRDLLEVLAEPAIAARDAQRRTTLLSLVASSEKKAKAVLMMDGSRSQSIIAKESGVDQGNLSRFVKNLASAALITDDHKSPKLAMRIPSNFFDRSHNDK